MQVFNVSFCVSASPEVPLGFLERIFEDLVENIEISSVCRTVARCLETLVSKLQLQCG